MRTTTLNEFRSVERLERAFYHRIPTGEWTILYRRNPDNVRRSIAGGFASEAEARAWAKHAHNALLSLIAKYGDRFDDIDGYPT